LVSTFKEQILNSQDYEIFEIFRNAKEISKKFEINMDDTMCDIVERASKLDLEKFDIKTIRDVYKKKIEERLSASRDPKNAQSDPDSEGSGSEEGTSCDICDENVPDMWCLVCKKMLCEKCHSSKNSTGHSKKHKVDENWGKYEGKLDDD